jgi:Chromo (CHRromatin Organisation MOdifier) domain
MGQWQVQNKWQYLVRWKDYSPTYDLWEDESAIHTPLLIQAYQQHLEPQSARQKPLINRKADKQQSTISQPMPPSVTCSGRMSKPTSKAQSASVRTLHIRTLDIKPRKLSAIKLPMSFVFSAPSISSSNNDTAQQPLSPNQSPGPS